MHGQACMLYPFILIVSNATRAALDLLLTNILLLIQLILWQCCAQSVTVFRLELTVKCSSMTWAFVDCRHVKT